MILEIPGHHVAEVIGTVNTPTTLRSHLVKVLSAGILSGKYKPGDRLN
jgi:hypothetical protein